MRKNIKIVSTKIFTLKISNIWQVPLKLDTQKM